MQCHNNRKSTKTSWYYAKKTKRYREQKETQVNAYLEKIAVISNRRKVSSYFDFSSAIFA